MTFDKFSAFRTVGDAATVARTLLAEGKPLKTVWRFAILQLLDDYFSVLRHEGVEAAERIWRTAPATTGDIRVNAAPAALTELRGHPHATGRPRRSTARCKSTRSGPGCTAEPRQRSKCNQNPPNVTLVGLHLADDRLR